MERNRSNRNKVLAHKGYVCEGCGFSFRETYGEKVGDYAEVHHVRPLSLGEQKHNAVDDFAVLCANCHRAVHRQSVFRPLTLIELRAAILDCSILD